MVLGPDVSDLDASHERMSLRAMVFGGNWWDASTWLDSILRLLLAQIPLPTAKITDRAVKHS
jgi:hypothetical protein